MHLMSENEGVNANYLLFLQEAAATADRIREGLVEHTDSAYLSIVAHPMLSPVVEITGISRLQCCWTITVRYTLPRFALVFVWAFVGYLADGEIMLRVTPQLHFI